MSNIERDTCLLKLLLASHKPPEDLRRTLNARAGRHEVLRDDDIAAAVVGERHVRPEIEVDDVHRKCQSQGITT